MDDDKELHGVKEVDSLVVLLSYLEYLSNTPRYL